MAASLGGDYLPVLLFGASGAIGQYLLDRLSGQGLGQGVTVMAVSRRRPQRSHGQAIWLEHDLDHSPARVEASVLVSLGPIRHALAQVEAGRRLGRVVAMSSVSTMFKEASPDPDERALMAELLALEQALAQACREREIDLTILKPTMIYGGDQDQNVSRIAGLTARLGLVPYCGRGMRQPVHADDLARLILDCLRLGRRGAGKFLLGGGETLAYPDMLRRVASARGNRVRLLRVPFWLLNAALRAAHASGRLRDIRPVMLARQAMDLVVDDQPARERLAWHPRPFRP